MLEPGEERTDCFLVKMPNDRDAYVSGHQIHMRGGTHHLIANLRAAPQPDGFGSCEPGDANPGLLAGSQAAVIDRRNAEAPENQGVAVLLPARSQVAINIEMRTALLDSALPVATDLADKGAFVFAALTLGANDQAAGAAGVAVAVAPMAGDGPFFTMNQIAMIPRRKALSIKLESTLTSSPASTRSHSAVRTSNAHRSRCSSGAYGYPASARSVRVRVLAGHVTVLAASLCSPC